MITKLSESEGATVCVPQYLEKLILQRRTHG